MSHGNLLHSNPTTGLELDIYNLQSLSNVEPNSQELVNKIPVPEVGYLHVSCWPGRHQRLPRKPDFCHFSWVPIENYLKKQDFWQHHTLWVETQKQWNKNWTYLETSFLLLSFYSDKKFNICCLGRKRYQWSYKMTPLRTTKPTWQA